MLPALAEVQLDDVDSVLALFSAAVLAAARPVSHAWHEVAHTELMRRHTILMRKVWCIHGAEHSTICQKKRQRRGVPRRGVAPVHVTCLCPDMCECIGAGAMGFRGMPSARAVAALETDVHSPDAVLLVIRTTHRSRVAFRLSSTSRGVLSRVLVGDVITLIERCVEPYAGLLHSRYASGTRVELEIMLRFSGHVSGSPPPYECCLEKSKPRYLAIVEKRAVNHLEISTEPQRPFRGRLVMWDTTDFLIEPARTEEIP